MVNGPSQVDGYDVDTALRLLGAADFRDSAPSGCMENLLLIIQNIAVFILRVLNYVCGDHQWYNNRTAHHIVERFTEQCNAGHPQDPSLHERVRELYDALLLRANGNVSYAHGIDVNLLQHDQPEHTSPAVHAPELKAVDIGPVFASIDSSKLNPISADSEHPINTRNGFLLHPNWNETPPPMISKSQFVPHALVEHLMRNKKNLALGVKYETGDAITNMEGALHTFVTPLCNTILTGDYAWKGTHNIVSFMNNQGRRVILSAAIQPDFECDTVMMQLVKPQAEAIEGRPLPEDFKILSNEAKQDSTQREAYDRLLLQHMIYHLTASHSLPKRSDIPSELPKGEDVLNALINDTSLTPVEILNRVQGKFVKVNDYRISLEVLLNTYIHQLHNEFSVLDKAAPQGYVYTINPPSIFAKELNGASLLNRLQILAFKYLNLVNPALFNHLQIVGFSEYADPAALVLLHQALPNMTILKRSVLYADQGRYSGPEGYALVIHNNSDAFGQNIEFEGQSSLDGVIGSYSSAACALKRDRPDLLDHVV